MKKVRIAFFADLHIRNKKIQSQTDFGSPSKWIPRQALRALNDINPDCIFGLGDLTATGDEKDWQGYKKWLSRLNAPVFDLMGNHDRDYTVFQLNNYGEGYFTVLGRTAATKAVKIGNLVFILVSEEHNPEGSEQLLTSTVPVKTFSFIENILQKYSQNNNVFVLSHTLPRGTTALSNDWSFNDINEWNVISQKFFDLFEKYPVTAHMTGHTHIDYRYRAKLKDIGGKKYKRKVGKFINGADYKNLPDTYFLNMACVDTAHGWIGSNFALLRKLGKTTAKAKKSPFRWLYIQLEEVGLPIFDILYTSKIHYILGRPAVYYFDVLPGEKSLTIHTRWLGKNKDTEKYPISLNSQINLDQPKPKIISSDLSLRKKHNLIITRDMWFSIPADQSGRGEFSQYFPKKRKLTAIEIKAKSLEKYICLWQGSTDGGKTWSKKWHKNPQDLGEINAVKIKIDFTAASSPAEIKNILVK